MSSEYPPPHIRPIAQSSLVRSLEQNSTDLLRTGFHLAQDAIHHTSLLLTEIERFGKHAGDALFRLGQFNTELRTHTKLQLQDLTQDTVEVITHAIHGLGEIARSAVAEARETIQAGEGLAKDLPKAPPLANPFQQRPETRSHKESTIIPITIQDNN